MARQYGYCSNYDDCSFADRRKIQDADDAHFICTECGQPLSPAGTVANNTPQRGRTAPPVSSVTQNIGLPLVLLVVCLLLLGGVLVVWWFGFPAPAANLPVPANNSVLTTILGRSLQDKAALLRLHGSNTIGATLAPALAEAFLKQKGYTDVQQVRDGELDIRVQGKAPSSGEQDSIEIKAYGTGTAFMETPQHAGVGLLGGFADIGLASGAAKADTVSAFQTQGLGDLTSRAQEHVVALDGVAVIVHANNPVGALPLTTIGQIFRGEINDWSAVPGANMSGAIQRYARDNQSGTHDTFAQLVLSGQMLDCANPINLKCFEDSNALSAHVASDPGGIGFVGLNYIGNSKALPLRMGDGGRALSPNRFTVKTEDYPLTRRLFFYQTRQPSPLASEFVRFALSDAGQQVVTDVGLVGVGLQDQADKAPPVVKQVEESKQVLLEDDAVPPAYKTAIQSADRTDTPLNFRFRSGSAELDNRAHRDVGRLAEKMSRPEFAGAKLVLIGFADPQGSPERNLTLSQQRASQIQQQLEAEGLSVALATGFGEEPALLLDSREDEPESLAKNRRVEVWLRR
ncbi:phosphate ABC transporter substrate-binding protein, PhoT family [Thiothrix caldifontis]|uniref:Phosphate ABC transporter substrate-binding protein, PhoT family n=1 Tax=Thiothrix caldifontis TaxID=525918 RepID=A0A1H3WN03_9GAMM|nr:substrate-binding domain-containing protein [Thiothrix caldifontis]SDZ88515.1 phosphate ABC transporter substrate-binding protein, PhoT family [Thiothrix caldifontis]